jgi:aspartate kinase
VSDIVVQKYGGSSVADTDRIKRVAARIASVRDQGKQVCVVVSAMGSTTNELLARAREISASPPRRELDMLLTCGERASMALLSMAVSELGYEAISFTGSQSGILTNDRHSGARIIEVRPIRVQDELERGKVVIVAGFQGVSYKREITTLGRGGSDTTAVALAAALEAEYCEICSDVDGVYSADPRVVDAAMLLDAISHDEMLELASHGAKVLHAEAVEFARRADIALYARATAQSATGDGGTRIDAVGRGHREGAAAGVAGQRGLVRVRTLLHAEAVLAVAEAATLPLQQVAVDGDALDMWFPLEDVPDWTAVRARFGDGVEVIEGMGAVSVVGTGIGRGADGLRRARAAATEAGIEVLGAATSPLRITLYCAQAGVDPLTRALHAVFCS